ncbi:hypothetical protein EHQ68_09990 [Leptospira congkakensis]|uniref:Porin n=1 Tax=Leptospira congkakensis TaxID=2484932 RepID=A0A4Z1A2W8_9LEPT|nr:hypothetical protein [Leptospira congkakensis]TGL88155.1 hypothetical protein EHQ68_09990 [Leptospira congkakensis]TGL95260.1 hypothetical protein EHQ69_02175 [Leptospira congkakensis]TGL96342.1 hypothetical protein EHQ70_09225 [Leptospira congkakensis]
MKLRKLLLLLVFVTTVSQSELYAQFTCEGSACSFLPSTLTEAGNGSLKKFETGYLNEVLKTNLEAGFLANIGANNIGTGTVRRIQFGVSASAAGYKKDDIQIQDAYIKYPKLPNVGGAVIPSFHLDFNPGWLLGTSEDGYIRRIGIFLHGMNVAVTEDQIQAASNNKNYEGRIAVRSYGGMVRYQLVEKEGFLMNLITWNGINVGVGHHVMEQNMSLSYQEGKAAQIEFQGVKGKWGGDTNFVFNTKVQTTNVDLRTGLGVFWIANVIVGGGYSWNSGSNSASLSRRGPFLVTLNDSLPMEIPREYQAAIDKELLAQNPNATLGFRAGGESHSKRGIGYGIVGLELDLFLVKVIAEGLYGGKDLYSANLGVKLSF